jgi:hypothetical protein
MDFGLTGLATLSWPGLMKLRAENALKPRSERTAVIMVFLPGGQSHLDTYDPKPESSSEYRGPFKTVATKVPGTHFTELMPLQAKIADKFTVLRSMNQTAGGHPAGTLQMLSGDPDTRDKPAPRLPDWMSVAHYLRSKYPQRPQALPNYVSVNPINASYCGPAYLGESYAPFSVSEDPNRPNFEVPNIGLPDEAETRRLSDRVALRRSLDKMERAFDREGELGALDQFESQAMSLLTNSQTRDAFDLSKEDARTRDRYGRNRWGQQLLLARRLVESGVEIITSSLHARRFGTIMRWIITSLRRCDSAWVTTISPCPLSLRTFTRVVSTNACSSSSRVSLAAHRRSLLIAARVLAMPADRRARCNRAATTGRAHFPTSGLVAASRRVRSLVLRTNAVRT